MAASDTTAIPTQTSLLTRAPSPLLVVGAIGSVQFGAAIAATLFARIGPGGAVWLRLVFGTVILIAMWRPRLRLRAYTRHQLLITCLFGVVLGGMNLTFYSAVHRIPLGIAVTLEFVGPLTVAVVGSRRPIDLLWVAFAVTGIIALTQGDTRHLNALGVVFALVAGALWGTYIIVNARVGRAFAGGTGLALAMCVASVVIVPFGIAQGGARLLEPRSLALGIAVGLLSSAIPYSCEMEALRRIRTSVFGVLMSIEPAIAALAGFIVLGQSLSARTFLGMALVVVASVGAALRTREAPIAV